MESDLKNFPSTRYQGSKRRILSWIKECLDDVEFNTALDVFGGTGAVSYLLKIMDKEVTFNDIMLCNATSARAIVRNSSITLPEKWLEEVEAADPQNGVVAEKYGGIFFTEEENKEIDKIANCIFSNPNTVLKGAQRDIALHALFQTLLMKRPFNLFHRANLDIRLKECDRNFGNKTTWEKPIMDLMLKNLKEANNAVFSNGKRHHVHSKDALHLDKNYDLVYIDPPYCSKNGICADYQNYYSFLDGLCNYGDWKENIDTTKKNLPLLKKTSSFTGITFEEDLKKLLSKYSKSVVVMSYKSPGKPTIDELIALLSSNHENPEHYVKPFSYALNRNNEDCSENLFIAMPKK